MVENWHALGSEMFDTLASGRLTDASLRRWAASAGRTWFADFMRVAVARWSAEQKSVNATAAYRRGTKIAFSDPLSIGDLAIDGTDLMELGIPAGPAIGATLRRLLDVVIDDPSKNQRDTLLALAGTGGACVSPLVYALLSALANVAGALAVAGRARRGMRLLDALIAVAAGFMISVALTQLVPEALARGGTSAPVVMLAGYLAVHFTQHTLTTHFHFGEETHRVTTAISLSALAGLLMHTFVDGVAIAAGFTVGPRARGAGVHRRGPAQAARRVSPSPAFSSPPDSHRSVAVAAAGALGLTTLLGVLATDLVQAPGRPWAPAGGRGHALRGGLEPGARVPGEARMVAGALLLRRVRPVHARLVALLR